MTIGLFVGLGLALEFVLTLPVASLGVVVDKASGVFDYIAEAARSNRKVAVYAIGQRILDWST